MCNQLQRSSSSPLVRAGAHKVLTRRSFMNYRRRFYTFYKPGHLALLGLLLLVSIDLTMQAKAQPAVALSSQSISIIDRAAGSTPSPTCTPVWSVVDSPNPDSNDNYLYGVAA